MAGEKNYSKRVRSEREDLQAEVRRSKSDINLLMKRYQEQDWTIQSLEKQVETRKQGQDSEENQTQKGVTAALQSQVEKRVKSLIGEMEQIFQGSFFVATLGEDDVATKATETGVAALQDSKKTKEDAKKIEEHPTTLPMSAVSAIGGSSSDSSSSSSEDRE